MNTKQSISIIIPYYNSSSTLERALISTITDIMDVEVIVIDDNSSDDCSIIIDKLKDKINIKYIRNEKNLGAGASRNRGLRDVTNEYIAFLDSDDELSPSFFSKIEKLMVEKYDEIIFDALQVKNAQSNKLKMFFSQSFSEGNIDMKKALVFIRGAPWGKIYRTEIIQKNNVEFGIIPRGEDAIFTEIATSFVKSIYYLEESLYLYHFNASSLTNDDTLLDPQNSIISYEAVQSRLRERNFDAELNAIFFLTLYNITAVNIKLNKSYKDISSAYSYYRKNYNVNDPYRNEYDLKYRVSFFLFEHKLFNIYKWLRSIVEHK